MRALMLAALMGLTCASAQAAVERPYPTVSVTGEGSVTAVPDLATVSAGIVSEGKTSREAAEANAKLMTAVIAAARQAGIAEKDIGTSRYSISPVYAMRRAVRTAKGRRASPAIARRTWSRSRSATSPRSATSSTH